MWLTTTVAKASPVKFLASAIISRQYEKESDGAPVSAAGGWWPPSHNAGTNSQQAAMLAFCFLLRPALFPPPRDRLGTG